MGVTGLWTVVQPCARPIKLETLNKKRLAVDASIWIYQFLKAVRDKEGNALRNSHVVGFFRRICKLLFFGIKPVFVFDGGAPVLKRQTVGARKARREGRREDAVRTAGKLLAVQMQRRAEEDERKRREERTGPTVDPAEEEIPDNVVYVDEIQMTAQERQQTRSFKKQDAYHLPDLPASLAEMGGPDDVKIMSPEELEEYARQFHTGEDINVYDFSKIDFNSPFFMSLPATDRYNILNAARLRSRLRMGYSKDQLDTMFPDRMAFSRFQIERVKERNELTQRLMNINGMNGEDAMFDINGGRRVAGERGKEYVLVKNDGVEGGWALGVVSNSGQGERNQPIDVEKLDTEAAARTIDEDEWEEDGFEDVPIEGLNRLPKRVLKAPQTSFPSTNEETETLKKRRALYEARQIEAGVMEKEMKPVDNDPDSLFLPQSPMNGTQDDQIISDDELFEDVPTVQEGEDEELQRAIAMSLEDPQTEVVGTLPEKVVQSQYKGPAIDKPLQFNQENAKMGRNFAHQANARAMGLQPRDSHSTKDNELEIDAPQIRSEPNTIRVTSPATVTAPSYPSKPTTFDGPLPFESINLGKSVFGRRKKKVVEEGGGFEVEPTGHEKEKTEIPPWFSTEAKKDTRAWTDSVDKKADRDHSQDENLKFTYRTPLNRHKTGEIIDVDDDKEAIGEIIEVRSSNDEAEDDVVIGEPQPIDSEVRMGDIADMTRAEPPVPAKSSDDPHIVRSNETIESPVIESPSLPDQDSDEPIEWEESDLEEQRLQRERSPAPIRSTTPKPDNESRLASPPSSSAADFEDVDIDQLKQVERPSISSPQAQTSALSLPTDNFLEDTKDDDEADTYSDPEEEDLMRQMAVEAEEHARFSATLNPQSHLQSAEDYEKELRQLRNQQKKDRRDADEVSQIMITECQQLLKLFGLPYVTAPMEAEAQCAELVNLGLVDGIVTDDSDVFLFGGTRVYKNMFNQAKFVECYLASDLEKEYSLTRPKLVSIAHLLGSDYTEGLPSVGPVTALEILSEFESLEHFSDWWATVQLGQPLSSVDTSTPFRKKFRKNAAKIFLPNGFPDKRVDEAYLHPEVDHDPSPFAWGVPDLDALRNFLMATIGWSQERTDEILVPVVKDMNRRETEGTQANITQFFGGSVGIGANKPSTDGAFAPKRRVEKSKRMTNALSRLHARAKEPTIDEDDSAAEDTGNAGLDVGPAIAKERDAIQVSANTKREPRKPRKRPVQDVNSHEGSSPDSSDDDVQLRKPRKNAKSKKPRKAKGSV